MSPRPQKINFLHAGVVLTTAAETTKWPEIAILTVYKQLFWYLNFANHRTKESFVTATNKPLVATLMTIGDVAVSIAIASYMLSYILTQLRRAIQCIRIRTELFRSSFLAWESKQKKTITRLPVNTNTFTCLHGGCINESRFLCCFLDFLPKRFSMRTSTWNGIWRPLNCLWTTILWDN